MEVRRQREQVRDGVQQVYGHLVQRLTAVDPTEGWRPCLDALFGTLLVELMVAVGTAPQPQEDGPMETELLTVDELAARLRVPRSWVYGKTRCNAIPHLRLGRHIRFAWSELEEWMRANAASAHQHPEADHASV